MSQWILANQKARLFTDEVKPLFKAQIKSHMLAFCWEMYFTVYAKLQTKPASACQGGEAFGFGLYFI